MKTTMFPDAVITGEVLERLRLDCRYELVEGRIETLTPTNSEHARVVAQVAHLLTSNADWLVLAGDPGLYIRRRPDTVRGPDVLLISRARYDARDPQRAFLTVAPELVVEVTSPSNDSEDVARKTREYLSIGSVVWVLNLDDQTLRMSGLDGTTTLLHAAGVISAPHGRVFEVSEFFA